MDFGEVGGSLCGLVELVEFVVNVPKEQAALADTGITHHNHLCHCSLISHYMIFY